MYKPTELTPYDFPDTSMRPSGYDMETFADSTPKNFQVLLENYNNLVEVVNHLCVNNNIHLQEEK